MRRTVSVSENVNRVLKNIAEKMGGGKVQIGFLEGAKYPDGTPVAAVAFWNEFGQERVPPRPFFRRMIAKESPGWPQKMADATKKTNFDGPRVLAVMGKDIEGALKESIVTLTDPPLAPSTIKRKGFAKPLINSAHMVNSVASEVTR